ncbi:MAG: hypothetical protein NVS2B12_27420 [Ktedonobacteraceae bacterium]
MRGLYRFYLYTVFTLLSVYAAYACSVLLSVLLRFSPLRASYETQPSSSDVVQAVTLSLVSFVVVLLIGGLHYWLIRRDIAQDAAGGTSAVRSFFLNTTEGIAAALSLPFFGWALLNLATSNDAGLPLAFMLSTLALALLLELERRRIATPTQGASAAFLRLHTYGVQAVLLIVLVNSWSRVLLPIIDGLFLGRRVEAANCAGNGQCPQANLFFLVLAGLWFVATWLFYGWLTSRDSSRVLRFILHGLGFAAGIGVLLPGLYKALHLLLVLIFRAPPALTEVMSAGASYDFIGPLTLGSLVAFIYHRWMHMGSAQGLLPARANLRLIELVILSVLAAATFWLGIGNLLYNTFALLLKFPQLVQRQGWLSAIALALAGSVSIAIEFYLQRKNQSEPQLAAGPRRAQVFALLAIGTLTFAVAIATTLYIGLTTLLGSPIANWTQVLSFGLATLLVGLPLAGFYFYTALNEHHFMRTTTPALEQTTHPEMATIESILGQLLANELTRAEASEQLHKLIQFSDVHDVH